MTEDEKIIAEHIKNNGTRCPKCGSEEIIGDEVTTGNGEASQEMSCNECGARWHNIYKLTSILILE